MEIYPYIGVTCPYTMLHGNGRIDSTLCIWKWQDTPCMQPYGLTDPSIAVTPMVLSCYMK